MQQTSVPIIDICQFEGELRLAGIGEVSGTGSETEVLCNLIAKLEREILSTALGVGLYSALKTGINTDPIPQRWAHLIKGVEWTDSLGRTGYSGSLRRFLACVVYDRYLRMTVTQTARSGEKRGKSENASDTSSRYKAVRASQEAWQHLRGITLYLSQAKDGQGAAIYPEYSAWAAAPWHFTPQNIFDL